MLPLLVRAVPSFAEKWEEHKREYFDEDNYLPYVALGEFNRHLVELLLSNETDELASAFEQIERFHVEGDQNVKESATIGCLEGLQNVAEHQDLDPEVFEKFLGPVSLKWWNQVNRFWRGEISYVGETIDK